MGEKVGRFAERSTIGDTSIISVMICPWDGAAPDMGNRQLRQPQSFLRCPVQNSPSLPRGPARFAGIDPRHVLRL